jgi:hypothetical protein
MPRTRVSYISYMVAYTDPETGEAVEDAYTTCESRDGWAEELHSRGIEVTVWTKDWSKELFS